MNRKLALLALLAAAAVFGAGCTVGPKYVAPAPTPPIPSAYKENANWKPAGPKDQIPRGKWWEIFQDSQLNSLEERIEVSNQTLRAAQQRFVQARALVRVERSRLYPTAGGNVGISRIHDSPNQPLHTSTTSTGYGDFTAGLDVAYEADVWGRVRNSVTARRAEAEATAADLEAVNLGLHAELAMDYFQLRGLDTQKQLLDSTVQAYSEALQLTDNRYRGGLASELDVAQARTQLETTRAQDQDVEVQRSTLEHAIAVLTGAQASTFGIAPSPLVAPPPAIPVGMPSELLERRPDVASAERLVMAANAEVGVARAAYFPILSLNAGGGFESTAITTLISGPSGIAALGAGLAQTIFDGGRRRAVTDQARSAYQQSLAMYQQTVLTAFQEVEDNLATLRILEGEAKTEDIAVQAAQSSLQLSENRYKGGVDSYLAVITAQSVTLADKRTAVDILTRRMTASVLLIKVLGGGWDRTQLPKI